MHTKRGFTIFFAMLVASLALSVGFAIYDLTTREIDLSNTATQSQYAIYAADTGAECVLYWDGKYSPLVNGASSAFATSSDPGNAAPPASGVLCATQDVAQFGTAPATYTLPVGSIAGWSAWTVQKAASAATTTFTLVLGTTLQSPCAIVQVGKSTTGGVLSTVVISRGYNTCSSVGLRVERALQVNY